MAGEMSDGDGDGDDTRLETARAFYARLVAAGAGRGELADRIGDAFAFVPREHFLGRGPWSVSRFTHGGPAYVETPSDDPILVYQNILIALDRDKGINNGEPWLHGEMIAALDPDRGDTVLHVGCGTGYYSAILAQLAGPSGKVIAYEIEPTLAETAARCLEPWENVAVESESGAGQRLPTANAIYVNAGATRPDAAWLDALANGGRLVFPLSGASGNGGWGVTLRILREGSAFRVRVVGRSAFIGCSGVSDADEARRVGGAVSSGAIWKARQLMRGSAPDDSALLVGEGWWLSSRPVE